MSAREITKEEDGVTNDQGMKSDYDRLSKEEWQSNVRIHARNLEREVTRAMRKAVRDYVLCVFSGAIGAELTFIGDVLTAFQASCAEKDLSEELQRDKLFGPHRLP